MRHRRFNMRVIQHLFLISALAFMLAACNTTPVRNEMLERTRAHLQSVQQDAQTSVLAPEEIKRAADSFGRAETAQRKGESAEKVKHLSYLAEREVIAAQDAALGRSAQAAGGSVSTEKNVSVLPVSARGKPM
jgi:hypothetical protein